MPRSLSALELAILIKELQPSLINAKVEKIYLLPEQQELLVQFHLPNTGKKILRVVVPDFLYLTETKQEMPEKPHGFCLFLRRHLNNTRLRAIKQIDFERILDFTFEVKEKTYHLMLELFSKGNIILCDQDYKILSPFSNQNWKERTIRGGLKYEHPSLKYNFLTLAKDQLKELIKATDKESIVKALALDLGLGGVYAEELCKNANIDKNKTTLDDKEANRLYKELQHLQKLEYKPYDPEKYASFNEALDKELTEQTIISQKQVQQQKKTQHLSKAEVIIKRQQTQVNKLEQEIKENQEKGEAIYQHYQLIKDIL
ncbi:NFACT family protein, partial [Candidatus Woesearchaeota archaeon]|nr:NFACT family protein [Candidatus Woesearchaeota archaeon]